MANLVKAKFMFRIPNLNLPVEQKDLRLKNCDTNYIEYNTTQQGWKNIFVFGTIDKEFIGNSISVFVTESSNQVSEIVKIYVKVLFQDQLLDQ